MCPHRAARPARRLRILFAATLVVGCLSLGAPLTVAAALGRTVNALTGTDTGNCNATLCKTIAYALTQAAAGDTILLAGGMTYPEHDLTVPFAVTITGPNPSTTFIDAGHLGRVFSVTVGNFLPFNVVTISGVTIRNGTAGSGNYGGGIVKAGPGTLTLTNSSVTGNTADDGGGIYSSAGGVTLTNSTVSSNLATSLSTADGKGGGIYVSAGTLTLTGSTVSANQATGNYRSDGGGIATITGTATLSSSTISGNQADDTGGGVSNDSAALTLTGVTISNNHAGYAGGGLYKLSGTLSLTSTTITGNNAPSGGGIENIEADLSLDYSTISGNQATAGDGGGIAAGSGGTLTVTNSMISGNTATGKGGGFTDDGDIVTLTNTTVDGNSAATGGGINTISLTVTTSTISGNTASVDGGGIMTADLNGETLITDSTISGNQAPTGAGGGIKGSFIRIRNSTIAFNSTGVESDSINQIVYLQGTIIAHSTGIADCLGVITSLGNNLDGGRTCGLSQATDLSAIDPLLGPLANYGGATTKSHSLLAGSPAIDQGGPSCPSPDQHGAARPQGAACDIGSFETVPPAPTLTALDVPAGIASGGTRITLTGTGFLTGATVTIGGVAATSVVVTSGTTLTLTTPAGPTGPVDVTFTNPGQAPGNGSATLAASYHYVSLSPLAGTPTGGDTVVIVGLPVAAGVTVSFGGTAATAVQVVNGTTLRVTTPAHPVGTVAVTVTNPGGTPVVLTGAFTYGTPTLPGAKPGGGTAGSPNSLPGTRPVGTTGGSVPNPLPPSR